LEVEGVGEDEGDPDCAIVPMVPSDSMVATATVVTLPVAVNPLNHDPKRLIFVSPLTSQFELSILSGKRERYIHIVEVNTGLILKRY
jgi:hypothetical protein